MATTFAFDGTNPAAQAAANRFAAQMVAGVSEETRAALKALIVRSIREGIPPYDAARMIRSMIGLNAKQAQAAVAYRQALIDAGQTLEKADALVERYAERKLRQRAETIARTEIMGALNEGSRQAYKQAQDEGLLGDDAKKEWIVTPDEALCPICRPLDGVQVRLDEDFQTSVGPLPGPPAHPNCRCAQAAVA
jgi:SPP1 gp7 family putative phage head morphogenesis protein